MTALALCIICASGKPQPTICRRCEDRIRRDLDQIGEMRRRLHEWQEIDPGTPCRDDRHLLALVDSPLVTESGEPDLTALAATDRRTKRIPSEDGGGWHPDDVVNVDAEILTEARWITEERHLSTPLADVFECLRIIGISRDWVMRHPRADEFAAIMAGCAAALRGVLHDTGDRMIGLCPAAHPERDTCGGPLRLAWRGPLPMVVEDQVKPTHIQCDWCKDPWPIDPASLVAMLRVVQAPAFPVQRAWAVDACGIRPDLLRQWIRRGHVRTYAGGLVDLVDVLARAVDTPDVAGA